VDRIQYRKGPYYAEEGDFASAGSARIALFDALPKGIAQATLGENGYRRGLLANSRAMAGGELLYALELGHNDGPWDHPEGFRRVNGVLRWSFGDAADHQSLTAMAYSANWNSTDQIPRRAVDQGLIGRFGAIDPSDHGDTARYSLSYEMKRSFADGEFKLNAYAVRSRLNLFSNFTFFLDNPVGGDQFEQAESRQIYGLATSRSWSNQLAGYDSTTTLGLQLRHDRLDPVGLYSAVGGQRTGTTQETQVRQTSVGVYAENNVQWTDWLRSVAGLRADHFRFDNQSSIAGNSGHASANLASPKLSLIFGRWAKTEYFANYGWGFHSNDSRGTSQTADPKTLEPVDPVKPLVRTKGGELGLRTEALPGLQSSLALWQLSMDSELLFVGDAGTTEPSRASMRSGVEWNNHYIASRWLLLDADLAWSRSRFNEPDPADPATGYFIPGSVQTVASLGATVIDLGPWFGQLQWRYFGPRPLIEDNSVRSSATSLVSARIGYSIDKDLKLMLDVFNLFDRKDSDIDYYYASRLKGEPDGGVNDIHFHPVEPRNFRLTLRATF
jgi:outer membrane receptor protein involved in Fe transport